MQGLLAYFDPAVDGFLRRMLRLLALLAAGAALLGCLALLVLGRRFEGDIRYWIGVAQLQTGRPAAAAETARALVEDFPDRDWYDYRLLATALRRDGRIEEHLEVIREGVERFPEDWRTHGDLCWYGALFDRAEEVMPACERSVELVPEGLANAHSRRGFARARTGDREGAIEDFREAVKRWEDRGRTGRFLRSRRAWLEALEAGEDPFDEATVERLRRYF